MKNKIILLLITFIASSHCVFAIQEGKVISDIATTKEKLMNDFDGVDRYTDVFFTPHIVKEAKKTEKNMDLTTGGGLFSTDVDAPRHGSMLPIPKFKLMIKNLNKPKQKQQVVAEESVSTKNQAILDCDFMEYFAPRTELEANGHVVMVFPQNNSSVKADKMIYNQTTNFIKAFGNVVLNNDGKEVFGDYMQIDMNEENALMDNPLSDVFQVRAKAKKGYMYGDKLIQEQGSMYITKKTMIKVRNEFFGPDLSPDRMFVPEKDRGYYKKENHGEKFKIKTTDLIINSKKEHDTVTLKHAEIYFNEKKVGTIPSITLHTNKNQDYVEADYPELGTMMNLGMYAGPGFDFDTPMGTNLKIVPIINYQSNSLENESTLGYGAIAKFKSATNKFDMAYGTANKVFILRGKQKLDDNMYFQYGTNSYMDDWFLGFRMPRLMGEAVYEDIYSFKDFIAKGLPMTYTHRIAGAYVQDGNTGPGQGPLGEDGIGTMRFKYMAEVAQTLYSFGNPSETPLNGSLQMAGQGSVAVYGTGDTQAIARIGPRIHTQYKNWMQDAGYFLSTYKDGTPLLSFDRYMYGRSNAYMRETFRLNKYLAFSWFGSLNLLQDSWDGKMLQENSFFLSIGPDDIKLHVGYDTIREQSFMTLALALDAKGTTVEYKKMVIKNPDTLGKKKGEEKQQSFSPSSSDENEIGQERAEVVDIKGAL